MEKENAVQVVVLMDTFNNNFDALTNYSPEGLFAVAGVPLIIYLLESLALGGVNKAILFCCNDGVEIKEYLRKAKEQRAPWSLSLDAQVLMSETCQTMGDVMREINAAGLINGYFVLTSINNIVNIPYASMLEQHKAISKKDKGAAMTLVYKQVSWKHPLINADKAVFLAADENTRKVLIYKTYKPKSNDDTIALPLESLLNHSKVKQLHNLLDANIAMCSPSVPRMFSDNFDFQTRDDFIHGILGNEGILASSLYYTLLKDNMYAATVTNRRTYKTISRDIRHQSVLPLSIKCGSLFQDHNELMGNNTFCHKTARLRRSYTLEKSPIGPNTQIGANTNISHSIIGSDCVIGNNVVITGSHIASNTVINDNCKIIDSTVNANCIFQVHCSLEDVIILANTEINVYTNIKKSQIGANGAIGRYVTVTGSNIGNNVNIKDNARVINRVIGNNAIVTSGSESEIGTANVNLPSGTRYKRTVVEDGLESNGKKIRKSTSESGTESETESTGSEEDEAIGFEKTWGVNYEFIGNNTFSHKTARVKRSWSLGNSQTGANSRVGYNTHMDSSTIGANAVIGNNVVIKESRIGSNAVVRDYARVINLDIGDNAVVG